MEPATMMGIGALMSGAGSLAGLFGGSSASESRGMMNAQLQMQREFAQNGISWRVADAKRAGIHPLYALGATTPSYSPVNYIDGGVSQVDRWAQAGQDLGRAVRAGASYFERTDNTLEKLAIERGELENELLRSQIAKEKAQIGPPVPLPGQVNLIPGQGDSPVQLGLSVKPSPFHAETKPQEVTPSHPERNYLDPAPINDLGFAWTGTGAAPVPSKDVKERIEDQLIPEAAWAVRNLLAPNFGSERKKPPASMLPEGTNNWRWSVMRQEWEPYYDPHRAMVRVRRNRDGHHGPDIP